MDREKVKTGIFEMLQRNTWKDIDKERHRFQPVLNDALALLKEQDAVVKQWIKEIADNQLAHAPKDSHEFMSLDEHLENEYKRGIWDGLQIAWNIISEGR